MHVELSTPMRGHEAARVDEVRLQVIGSFCHDIRQPLNAALLRAAALAEQLDASTHGAAVRDLQLSLREIATTSETVFDAVRLSSAEVTVQRSLVYLPRLCSRLASTFQVQAQAKGLRVRFVANRVVAETDDALLTRLLQNIISNAIKATPKGAILTTCRLVGDVLRCEVRDSGVGMSRRQLEALASPRLEPTTTTTDAATGSGIGLWNAREFARLLGARLRIDSEPGRGTRVRIDVPCAPRRQDRSVALAWTGATRERSVMVLCDDRETGRSTEHAFVDQGWTCSTFDDPLRFLATINTPGLRPSAIVIPGKVGNITAEFLLRILSSRFEALPIIVHLRSPDDATASVARRFSAELVLGSFTSSSVPTS